VIVMIQIKSERDVKESEKQWQLQRKVGDLTAQASQLEKRVTCLKEENELLVGCLYMCVCVCESMCLCLYIGKSVCIVYVCMCL